MNNTEKTPCLKKNKKKVDENDSPNIISSKYHSNNIKNLHNTTICSLNTTNDVTDNKRILNSELNCNSINNKIQFFNINEDERYSILKIKQVKNKKFSPYKTTSRLIKNYQKCDEPNSINKIYYTLLKKKKINSLQKSFSSEVSFYDDLSGNKKMFKIFRDCEIGITENWQEYQQIVFNDDDINSDNEEINNGKKLCFNYIKNTLDFMKKCKKYNNISFYD